MALTILLFMQTRLLAQAADSLVNFSAIIYDDSFIPVPATHVFNLNSRMGDVTDSLGIFSMLVHSSDTLFIRNIAFRDTIVPVNRIQQNRYIVLKRRVYELEEAKIFEWGATYDDFREAFIGMPVQQTLSSSLDLPRQDPEKVPVEMDEKAVKSVGLLLTQPVSYFYYNFSKYAKSARKVYWLEKNEEKIEQFDALISAENLSDIAGLNGTELQDFQLFLSQRMVCDYKCSEFSIYNEIYGLWKVYQDLEERGMLDNK